MDHEKIQIRKAQLGDELEIAKIHIQSWQEAYKKLIPQSYLDNLSNELNERTQMWSRILTNPQRWAWVATVSNQIVGFILFGPPRDKDRDGFIELGAIYLLQSHKGMGIGFSLLTTGFEFMSSLGYKKSYCWVLEGNPTINFYKKSGAAFSGHIKTDEIGGQQFNELAYEWASTPFFGTSVAK